MQGNNIEINQKDAIDILNKQIGKLNDPNYPTSDLWAVQTSSFIKKFFGENSDEYIYVKTLKVRSEWNKLINWPHEDKQAAKLFLSQCIQTIERTGLYRPPKGNIFTTTRNEILVPAILVIMGGIFYFGFYVGNINSNNNTYELKEEIRIQKDSIRTYRQSVKSLNSEIKSLKKEINKNTTIVR
ncbi:MAG: hypothetical protein COW65_11250 [Cytophagales bacterium CG18_big_fil_WC_8_21_14_2_50_42_9]|nr:MAG: hypothetical protein COW65_11250 [Cytophagales bacterium CG18_big_fil_WC_8_21_14_2_50_42_9]